MVEYLVKTINNLIDCLEAYINNKTPSEVLQVIIDDLNLNKIDFDKNVIESFLKNFFENNKYSFFKDNHSLLTIINSNNLRQYLGNALININYNSIIQNSDLSVLNHVAALYANADKIFNELFGYNKVVQAQSLLPGSDVNLLDKIMLNIARKVKVQAEAHYLVSDYYEHDCLFSEFFRIEYLEGGLYTEFAKQELFKAYFKVKSICDSIKPSELSVANQVNSALGL